MGFVFRIFFVGLERGYDNFGRREYPWWRSWVDYRYLWPWSTLDVSNWYTPPKFNIAPGNGGWKTILSFWGPAYFQGRTVKLREGIAWGMSRFSSGSQTRFKKRYEKCRHPPGDKESHLGRGGGNIYSLLFCKIPGPHLPKTSGRIKASWMTK